MANVSFINIHHHLTSHELIFKVYCICSAIKRETTGFAVKANNYFKSDNILLRRVCTSVLFTLLTGKGNVSVNLSSGCFVLRVDRL